MGFKKMSKGAGADNAKMPSAGGVKSHGIGMKGPNHDQSLESTGGPSGCPGPKSYAGSKGTTSAPTPPGTYDPVKTWEFAPSDPRAEGTARD